MTRWNNCKTEYDNSRLLLSNGLVTAFDGLVDNLQEIVESDRPVPDKSEQMAKLFNDALTVILRLAKSDLNPSA